VEARAIGIYKIFGRRNDFFQFYSVYSFSTCHNVFSPSSPLPFCYVCAERSIQLLSARSKSLVTYETAERLENEIRDLLRNWNVDATIEDSITGNTTTTADLDDE
jgi:hypothetical protein